MWNFGSGVSLPIFAGGPKRANPTRSRAVYEEAVAKYRQSVLAAFADVENSLLGLRYMA